MDKPSTPEEKQTIRNQVQEQMFTLLAGGLGLVAALAWNDAVTSLFAKLFPKGDGLIYKFGYAVVVTVVIVLVSMHLRRSMNKDQKK